MGVVGLSCSQSTGGLFSYSLSLAKITNVESRERLDRAGDRDRLLPGAAASWYRRPTAQAGCLCYDTDGTSNDGLRRSRRRGEIQTRNHATDNDHTIGCPSGLELGMEVVAFEAWELSSVIVVAGLDPAIQEGRATLDARVKPEHDKLCGCRIRNC